MTAATADATTTTTIPDAPEARDQEAAAPRATKKQKTGATSAGAVKAVKTVDPAIILQRRDAVQQRVLKLESKLAKDRALLAKYSVPYPPSGTVAGTSGEEEEDEDHAVKTADA
jgi:hypothetical protein